MYTEKEKLLLQNSISTDSLLIDLMDTTARLSAVGFVNDNKVDYKAIQTAMLELFMRHLDKADLNVSAYLESQEQLVNKYINILRGVKNWETLRFY